MTAILLKKTSSLGKLNSKELYNILILSNYKHQCHKVIETFFESHNYWLERYLSVTTIPLLAKNSAPFNTKF